MRSVKFQLALTVAALSTCSQALSNSVFTEAEPADDGYPYTVDWAVSMARQEIQFRVTRWLKPTDGPLPPAEWFALALHPTRTTMKDTDMIFVVAQGGDCVITDRWSSSGKQIPPELDTNLGGADDVNATSAEFAGVDASGHAYFSRCSFTRALDTGDRFDHAITIGAAESMRLSVAYGGLTPGGTFNQHDRTVRGDSVVFFRNGGYGQFPVANALPRSHFSWTSRGTSLLFWHAALMLVAWFVLMLPATYLARFLKSTVPAWFAVHWRMQAMAAACFVVGLTLAIVEVDALASAQSWHVVVGFVVAALVPLQLLAGYLSNALWYEGKPPHWWPDKLHWWLGRVILVLGAVNALLGVNLFGDLAVNEDYLSTVGAEAYRIVVALLVLVVVTFGVGELVHGQQHEYLMLLPGVPGGDIDAPSSAYTDITAAPGMAYGAGKETTAYPHGIMLPSPWSWRGLKQRVRHYRTVCQNIAQQSAFGALTIGLLISGVFWLVIIALVVAAICVLCLHT